MRFRVTGMTLITLFVYPVAAAFAGTVWGLFINLKLPVYNWTNETTVVKQSAASFFALIFGIIVSIYRIRDDILFCLVIDRKSVV